jgi:hypothetical protein
MSEEEGRLAIEDHSKVTVNITILRHQEDEIRLKKKL